MGLNMSLINYKNINKWVLAGGLALSSLMTATMAYANEVKTARLGHIFTDSHPRGIAMQRFADTVKEKSNGEITIDIFSSSTLGSEQQMLQAIQGNVQQFYLGSLSPLSGRQKELQIFDFPFLFQSHEEAAQVLDGPVGQKMLENLYGMRMYPLTWSGGAFRDLANNKHAVNSLEDMKGLKIRVMPTKVAIDSFQAMGINPVPLAYSEVFTALETGVLDGHENPVVDMYQNKLYEVENNLTTTNHVYTPVALVVSKKWFDTLTPEQQAIVRSAAEETRTFQRAQEISQVEHALEQLEENGMKISTLSPEDMNELRAVVQPVFDKHTKIIGAEFVEEFVTERDRVRQSLQ